MSQFNKQPAQAKQQVNHQKGTAERDETIQQDKEKMDYESGKTQGDFTDLKGLMKKQNPHDYRTCTPSEENQY